MATGEWKGTTGGTSWMQRSLPTIYRLVGLCPMYVIMAFVVPFYMLFSHNGYIATYRFFRQRMNYGCVRAFVNVYRNHFVFGQVVLDRFASYGGKKFKLNMDGYDRFLSLANGNDGFIMLSSHIGNYELAGYSLVSEKKAFKALVYGGETATVMENRLRMLGHNHISLIPISDDMSHIFAMSQTLSDGEILSMSGDRILGHSRTVECNFFGAKAKFPVGPFALAVQREVKMLAVFVMKNSIGSYNVHIREIGADGNETDKARERVTLLAQRFADELEKMVRRYPTQWFNYYDFWTQS